MSATATDSKNRTARITDKVELTIPWRVRKVIPLSDYRFAVSFMDGYSGVVEMSKLIFSSQSGVFASLRDPDLFASLRVRLGVVTWPRGIDLATDAMYDQLKKNNDLWCIEP